MSDPAKQIQKLAQLARDLRSGKDFSITRLTIVKRWCRDPQAAAEFVIHVARLAEGSIRVRKRPSHITPKRWTLHRQLAAAAVAQMESLNRRRTTRKEESLWKLLGQARSAQNVYEKQRWGHVRIIECRELLIIETALKCLLHPYASEVLCYQVARQYCERYNARYGTGLIPESAPHVEALAEFWSRYHLGRGIAEAPETAPARGRRVGPRKKLRGTARPGSQG